MKNVKLGDNTYEGVTAVKLDTADGETVTYVENISGGAELWSVHSMDTLTIYQCDNPTTVGNILEVK